MAKVVDIESNQPHLCVVGPSNDAHVISVETVKQMAEGKIPLIQPSQKRQDEDLIRGILAEWLGLVDW